MVLMVDALLAPNQKTAKIVQKKTSDTTYLAACKSDQTEDEKVREPTQHMHQSPTT